jgi:hypothetical protein
MCLRDRVVMKLCSIKQFYFSCVYKWVFQHLDCHVDLRGNGRRMLICQLITSCAPRTGMLQNHMYYYYYYFDEK